jgi:porphobilinogen synthase
MAGLSLRRTRLTGKVRDLTRQVRLGAEQFIQPLFVVDGMRDREAVPGMHEVWRDTPATLLRQVEADLKRGVNKFLLFDVPATRGLTEFEHAFGATQIEALKQRFGNDIWLAVDVCLCSSTEHGHCGVLNDSGDTVMNEPSVAALSNAAAVYARAGADCVAPSDMMDGRVAAIRATLDAQGHDTVCIMSYAVKFHSSFYGPFRIAADSSPAKENKLKNRASYQLDPARPNDALMSARRDAEEGADILMVKPALPYLDILSGLAAEIPLPWSAYQTSGEAAGIELVSQQQLGERKHLYLETWTSMVRAGATSIISYAARDARRWLTE